MRNSGKNRGSPVYLPPLPPHLFLSTRLALFFFSVPDEVRSHLSMTCGSGALACLLLATASRVGFRSISQHLNFAKTQDTGAPTG